MFLCFGNLSLSFVMHLYPQAHEPTEQQLAVGAEGGLGENGREVLDEFVQRRYHDPHEGDLLSGAQ